MKKTLIAVSMGLLTVSAFAAPNSSNGRPGQTPQPQTPQPQAQGVDIDGHTVQLTSLTWTGVKNQAAGLNSIAHQNISSNTAGVSVNKNLLQATVAKGSFITNKADANSKSAQNLASNVGQVAVNKPLIQAVLAKHSYVGNYSKKGVAVQNISTNNACVTCQ